MAALSNVLRAPRGQAGRPGPVYRDVIVVVRDGARGRAALDEAIRMAEHAGSRLTLVSGGLGLRAGLRQSFILLAGGPADDPDGTRSFQRRVAPVTTVTTRGSTAWLVGRRLGLGTNDAAVLPGGFLTLLIAGWLQRRTGAPVSGVRTRRRSAAGIDEPKLGDRQSTQAAGRMSGVASRSRGSNDE
jgi:hypothetical protein